ncbi:MAG: metal ABC transporter permease [Chloroflexi bacterium]|nr:metal ABC transporter permease [Chloroflexota bacterium]
MTDTIIDLIATPLRFPFMQRGMIEVVLIGLLCGAVGSFVVLRGLAFIGDALAHAVFPGLVIAFLAKANITLGALAFGVITSLAIGILSRNRRVSEDTSIGILFAGMFALGIVLLSTVKSYTADLNSFLFGHVLAVGPEDVVITAVVGGLILLTVLALYKELLFVSFDPHTAQAQGLPVFALDLLLLLLLTLTIVLSLQAVGNVLVVALLVTPSATARLLTDRLPTMMGLGALLGALSGVVGLYVSYYAQTAPGGTIVLIATALFLVTFVASPKHGALSGWLARRRSAGLAEGA